MPALTDRDIAYDFAGEPMSGYFCGPDDTENAPGIVLVHDAFGLTADMITVARRFATQGLPVFALDMWGDRHQPSSESEIGPLIGSAVSDRERWMGRIGAGIEAFGAQSEVDREALVIAGYCVGGSAALEFVRTGGRVRGAVGIHAGLDLLDPDWGAATASARVLVCTGADDPMATAELRDSLQEAMTGAGIDWEVDLYSNTKHAFTNPKSAHSPMPDVVAYNPRSAARAMATTQRFIAETLT